MLFRSLARLKRDGCEIVASDAIDRAGFEAATAPIRARETVSLDPDLRALIEDTRAR